jgi:VanZ family protein
MAVGHTGARRTALAWGAVFAYCAFIFYLSSRSHLSAPRFVGADKVGHLGLYSILGALTFRALHLQGASLRVASLGAVAFAMFYGASDELHQAYVPNRSPDLFDLLADAMGSSLGVVVMRWRRRAPESKSPG